jgi:hypothetical protein
MSVKFFIGQFRPQRDTRCQLTGRIFGPSIKGRQLGHKLIAYFDDGRTMHYSVFGRDEAEKLRQTIDQQENKEE